MLRSWVRSPHGPIYVFIVEHGIVGNMTGHVGDVHFLYSSGPISSAGQSVVLIMRRSWVRSPYGPIHVFFLSRIALLEIRMTGQLGDVLSLHCRGTLSSSGWLECRAIIMRVVGSILLWANMSFLLRIAFSEIV